MCLIGNDLLHINTNNLTFSRKDANKIILNNSETSLFFEEPKNSTLQIIWTIKESVYKISCKQGNCKAFSPSNFSILSFHKKNNNIHGEISFENKNYFFKTILKQNYIFSFATTINSDFHNIKHYFFRNYINNNISMNNIAFIKFLENKNWSLKHSKFGVPTIVNIKNIDISITHDHNILSLSQINN